MAALRAGLSARGERRWLAEAVLARAPGGARGDFEYSNLGYIVADAILEAATDADWEILMKERIFAPLGMAFACSRMSS